MKVVALVCAGGRGSRMGTDSKMLLTMQSGQTVLERTLDVLKACSVSRCLVVTGYQAEAVAAQVAGREGVEVVPKLHWQEGLSSSLKAGLTRMHPDEQAVMVCLGDMPFLRPVHIETLLQVYRRHPRSIVAPRHGGRRGHPVIFDREYVPAIMALQGDRGAAPVIAANQTHLIAVDTKTDDIHRDLDRPADLLPRVVIRGGGDLATGVAHRLARSGFPVAILELASPRMIRTNISFAQAVYSGECRVEGVLARCCPSVEWKSPVEVVVDPEGSCLAELSFEVLVDARMLKQVADTRMEQADLVIALGPGFEAGRDAHVVIETQRGHSLGRVIETGYALADTGIPGELGGQTRKRVIWAETDGVFSACVELGAQVEAGQLIGRVDRQEVRSELTGTVRGLLSSGLTVRTGEKLADVDPRAGVDIHTISDKSRAIGGAVLEAIMHWRFGRRQ